MSRFLRINLGFFCLYGSIKLLADFYEWYVDRLERKEINETLFTNDSLCLVNGRNCHGPCDKPYCYHSILSKMESYIDSSQSSIYICLNMLTNISLRVALLRAHQRGIVVKIITNSTTSYASGSQIQELHEKGIQVRFQKNQSIIHHKFCLIDSDFLIEGRKKLERDIIPQKQAGTLPKSAIVLTGSMNWTFQAMNANWENYLITSDKLIVSEFHQEFLQIWNDPNIVDFY